MTDDNRPPLRDFSLLFPLLVGILSLIGIGVLVRLVWFPRQNAPVLPTRTATPFKYLFLGTETASPTPRLETATASEFFPTVPPEVEGTPLSAPIEQRGTPQEPPILALTEQAGTPTDEFSTPVFTITPGSIFSGSEPMTAGTYDGADSQILSSGSWTNQGNSTAYQGTLLVSNTVGNSLALSFIGSEIQVGYLSSSSAGSLTITIDGSSETVSQSAGNKWISPSLEVGTHYVILMHESGSTVNLDYIVIVE